MSAAAREAQIIREEIQRIAANGTLGRSRTYHRLLDYLAGCSVAGRRPKELEIASEVFGKGSDFDPNQDSLVRVYVHNLRQKIETYYSKESRTDGFRLQIPKGEYRLAVVPAQEAAADAGRPVGAPPLWLGVLIALLGINLVVLAYRSGSSVPPTSFEQVSQSALWADLLDDSLPLLVVVGDYYIFAELDEDGYVRRLVREFDINTRDDLDQRFVYEPELLASYMDLDLTYLPQGSASALKDLLRVIYASDKPVRVTPMSELTVADLKTHHVIYLGYISALGTLMDFVFASSGLVPGETYDELEDRQTGVRYVSGAGIPRADRRNYTDYGLFSTFPGPEGNQFVIIAGTRDSGVMHTAQAVTSLRTVDALLAAVGEIDASEPLAVEALYEVTGFDRVNLDAMLVYTAVLDYRRIWGGGRPQ